MNNETMNNETMNNLHAERPISTQSVQSPTSNIKRILGWVAAASILVALLGMIAVKLFQVQQGQVSSGAAPDFTLNTFDGKQISLQSLRGKVVVLNFWASWCKPCEEEAADLEAFNRAYKDKGVVMLGADYVDTEKEALAYLKKFNITYPNGPDLGTKMSQAYRIKGVPETFVIDKQGQLIKVIVGPTTAGDLAKIVEPLLK